MILAKIAVIENFSKVSWKNWACLPTVDWNITHLKKTWAKMNWNLSKNPDIVIQKSDKGNSVAILDKKVYLWKMKEILNKNDQLIKLWIQENFKKHYTFFIILEKKIREPLREWYQLNITDDNFCHVGSHFSIFMFWPKYTNSW